MREIVVDNFAGGGGASTGIEMALGRPVNVACNHDPQAIAMHQANHPETKHYTQNLVKIDPREVADGRPIGLCWFSPDCKHFSKAKGGKPVEKKIRDLAWVVIHWAELARPRVIILENVEEFTSWGPLTDEGKPCKVQKGLTFRRWVRELRRRGYSVEWRELRACDYGAPTTRKRLFLVARCDGQPIVWPAPTHGPGLLPYRTAAECIDWSLPVKSIFGRKRPLAENTLRRIARGVFRYVIEAQRPFIIPLTHHGDHRVYSVDDPMRTVTAAKRGEFALINPWVMANNTGNRGKAIEEPVPTVTTGNRNYLVASFLAQHNTRATGHGTEEPVSTITARGSQQQLVTSHLEVMRNNMSGQAVSAPIKTITAGANHFAEVRAFLVKYYGGGVGADLNDPLHTVTTRDRFGLVTVNGVDYQIVDIGMRMLSARELFRAQGFPDSYVIAPVVNGKPLTKTAQVRMCGNSVCPPIAAAMVRANYHPREASPKQFEDGPLFAGGAL